MRVIIALLVSSLAIAPAHVARAQEATEPVSAADEPDAEALRLFREGERHYLARDYVAALASFEGALELATHDRIRFNVAMCLERLGRYLEARDQMRIVIDSADIDDAGRERARAVLERVSSFVATLEVSGAVGAALSIDGATRCALPCSVELDPGEHRVDVSADGASVRRDIELARGERRALDITLPRPEILAPLLPPPRLVRDAGWLAITSGALAAIGTGVTIGMAVHTQALHDRFTSPGGATDALLREGGEWRDGTTVAGVATGVVLGVLVIDLVLGALGEGTGDAHPP